MRNEVTVRDIAEAAGVSHAAVLKVLNGRPAGVRVSAETRERILAIVRQSGYRPNRVARDMALGRHTTLGLVMAPGGPDASAVHLAAIEAVLAAAGYRLTLIVLPVDSGAARERVTALLHDGVAGLLCAPSIWSVAAQVAAGMCPVIAMGPGAGETILKALGVEVKESRVESPETPPLTSPTPPPPHPVVAEPTKPKEQPIPAVITAAPAKSIPTVVAAVPGGTVTTPPAAPTPVSEPNPMDGGALPPPDTEPAIIEPTHIVPAPSPVIAPVATPPPVVNTEPAIPEPATPIPEPEPAPVFTPPIAAEPVPEPIPLEGGAPACGEPAEPSPPDTEPAIIEPTPIVPDQPPSVVVAPASGEFVEPIPSGTDFAPVITPEPVLEPVPEIPVFETPTPEPDSSPSNQQPINPATIPSPEPEPAPVFTPPIATEPVSEPNSLEGVAPACGEPVEPSPPDAEPAIIDPTPVVPAPSPVIAPVATPPPVVNTEPATPEPTTPIPEPEPVPVFTPPIATEQALNASDSIEGGNMAEEPLAPVIEPDVIEPVLEERAPD